MRSRFTLAAHGGAGTIERSRLTPELERAYRDTLSAALRAGHDLLAQGGTSVDAVIAVVTLLEDSPLFNAGKGAVFTHDGTHELDAAVMDGRTLAAGAVAGVTRVANPVRLARLVMDRSPHVLLIGAGAEAFAAEQGMALVAPDYFSTERRRHELARAMQAANAPGSVEALPSVRAADEKLGTVGAVALDAHGDLAAATSTGGTTNKRVGRVGDSPIIGAGTYATNDACAISCTGIGEHFMRHVVAYDVAARMRYRGEPLARAAEDVVMRELATAGGAGGLVAVDRQGNVAAPFNTPGMYRGWIGLDGVPTVKIFWDE